MLRRVVSYMLKYYKWPFLLVIVCILIAAIATVIGATFPQTLVDDYITPMINSGSTDFSALGKAVIRLVMHPGDRHHGRLRLHTASWSQ